MKFVVHLISFTLEELELPEEKESGVSPANKMEFYKFSTIHFKSVPEFNFGAFKQYKIK